MNTQTLPQPIHIIFAFSSGTLEDESWRLALEIYAVLTKRYAVELWAESESHPKLSAYPVRRISPFRGEMPHRGMFVFVGVERLPGKWYEHSAPDKVMLECTAPAVGKLYAAINRVSMEGRVEVDVGFASDAVKRLSGLPGRVHVPTHGLESFLDIEVERPVRPFTLGKACSDRLRDHHFRDATLYRELIKTGSRVSVAGGAVLIPYFDEKAEGLTLLPKLSAEKLPDFFAGIDCFFYRTALHCQSSFPVSVLQAMASGLPIIAHRQAGCDEFVRHGENGFIFDSNDDARELISHLTAHRHLVQEMGARSRQIVYDYQARPWHPYE